MKFILDRIASAKGRPHHEKQRIVFSAAGIGAGFIAFIWLGTSLATGAFAIKDTSFADAAGGLQVAPSDGAQTQGQLAGAAAATAPKAPSASPGIQIIDTATSSTLAGKKAEATVIPF
jgi:hypothetical protein